MPLRSATPIALCLAFLLCPPWLHAGELGYAELVKSACAADPEAAVLALAIEKARLGLEEASLEAGGPALVLSTGQAGILFAPGGPVLSLSPSLEYGLPRGPSLRLELPMSLGGGEALAYPLLGLGLPLIRTGDRARAGIEAAKADLETANRALSRRGLEVERLVASSLLELSQGEYGLLGAQREVSVARQAVQKAVTLDGATKGGSALLSLERELRVKERKERDARAVLSGSMQDLVRLCGLEIRAEAGYLDLARPAALPRVDLDRPLPSPGDLASVGAARNELRIAQIAAEEGGRTRGLSLDLSAGWSTSAPTGTAALPGIKAGLGYTGGDFDLGFSLGYQDLDGTGASSGPLLLFQAAWKPQAGKKAELGLAGLRLAATRAEARVASAIDEGRKNLAGLAARRETLKASAEDAAEDLSFAAEELAIYGAWKEKGAVTDSEYEEVLAFEREARARALTAGLEALLWSLDVDLLSTGAREAGQP
jgi:hypothetical protein